MSGDTITVFLADDHTILRQGIASLLAGDPQLRVVGQCGDGSQVTAMVQELRPDVLLLDITMPGLNGLDVCREIVRKVKGTAVLILSMHSEEHFVARALEYGASGYLMKEAAAEQLSEALRTVMRGELFLGPGIPRSVVQRIARGGGDAYESLTPRERQVLHLIAEGLTNREVGGRLQLSVKTVNTHRWHLMHKLGLHDKGSLVKFALRKGLVTLE